MFLKSEGNHIFSILQKWQTELSFKGEDYPHLGVYCWLYCQLQSAMPPLSLKAFVRPSSCLHLAALVSPSISPPPRFPHQNVERRLSGANGKVQKCLDLNYIYYPPKSTPQVTSEKICSFGGVRPHLFLSTNSVTKGNLKYEKWTLHKIQKSWWLIDLECLETGCFCFSLNFLIQVTLFSSARVFKIEI